MSELKLLTEAVERYLLEIRSHYPQTSYLAYRRALRLFLVVTEKTFGIKLGREAIDTLNIAWAKHFLTHLQQNHAVETEHLYSRAVLGFYHYAAERDWSAADTAALAMHIATHRRPKHYQPPQPPLEAIDQLLTYVQTTPTPTTKRQSTRERLQVLRDKAFLLTLADTGLRISEMCVLRLSDLSQDRTAIHQQEHRIELRQRSQRALNAYLSERSPLDQTQTHLPTNALPIFARHDKRAGKRVLPISRWTGNNIVNHWVTLALSEEQRVTLEQENQPITPQTFRHYFVVTTLTTTGDPTTTQQLARHAHPTTTRRYVRALKQEEEQKHNDHTPANSTEE